MKISVAHICHWHDGVGIGVRGTVLTLEPCAGFTLVDYFFDGFVDARPEETSMCKQL